MEPQQLIDEAIADVLPSQDPLDDPNFDVTAMLNTHFPSELSLSAVESPQPSASTTDASPRVLHKFFTPPS